MHFLPDRLDSREDPALHPLGSQPLSARGRSTVRLQLPREPAQGLPQDLSQKARGKFLLCDSRQDPPPFCASMSSSCQEIREAHGGIIIFLLNKRLDTVLEMATNRTDIILGEVLVPLFPHP